MRLEDDQQGWFDEVNDELEGFLQEDALVDAIQSAPQGHAVSTFALDSGGTLAGAGSAGLAAVALASSAATAAVSSAVRAVAPTLGGGNARVPADVETQEKRRFDGHDGPFTKAEFMEYYNGSTVEWDAARPASAKVDPFDLLDDAAPVACNTDSVRRTAPRSGRRQQALEPLEVASPGSEEAGKAAARRRPAAWQNVAKAGLLALAALIGMFMWGPSLWSPPEKLELPRAVAVQRLPRIELPSQVVSTGGAASNSSTDTVHGQRISGQIGVQLRDGDIHASEEALKGYNASLVAAAEPEHPHGESSNERGRRGAKKRQAAGEDEIRYG